MKVTPIDYNDCKEWFLKKHYAKRIPPVEFCFGLYTDNVLCGVCSYGTPVSNPLRNSMDGFKLYELNRLVINDGMPSNSLSWFVAHTLKLMPAPCVIVSYADTSQGHHGYIYQATNWIYTGLSAKRTDWKIKGMEHLHGGTIADISRGAENRAEFMRLRFGNDFYTHERPRKHRYFYFIGDKRQKKTMMQKLPYSVEPYPKGENKRYDASYTPTTQCKLL